MCFTCCLTADSLSVAQIVARNGSTTKSKDATRTRAEEGVAANLPRSMWQRTCGG